MRETLAEHSPLVKVHANKTVVCMEGPAFSTRAESNMYRQLGGDIINMSALPEAKLAREAELSYVLIATCTCTAHLTFSDRLRRMARDGRVRECVRGDGEPPAQCDCLAGGHTRAD